MYSKELLSYLKKYSTYQLQKKQLQKKDLGIFYNLPIILIYMHVYCLCMYSWGIKFYSDQNKKMFFVDWAEE